MPESKFELGVDLIPSDSLLDGLTFDDLILAVHCNCREVTRAAVHAELSRMLASRKQDMNFLLEKFMDAAIYYDTERKLNSVQEKMMALISDNYKAIYQIYSKDKDEVEKLYLRLLLVTDSICGMTDSYAKSLYQELNGLG